LAVSDRFTKNAFFFFLIFFVNFFLVKMRDAFFGPLRPCYRLLGVTHAPGQESLALVLRLLWSAVCILQGMGFIWAFGHDGRPLYFSLCAGLVFFSGSVLVHTAHRVVRRTGDANIIAVLDSCEIGDAAVKKFRSVHVPIVFAIGVTLVILIFVLNLVTDILAGFENSFHVALSVGYLPAGFALVWPSMLVLLHFRALLLAARTVRADLLRCARGGNAARRTQDSADKFGPSSSSSSFALASSPETGDPAAAAAASVVRQRHTHCCLGALTWRAAMQTVEKTVATQRLRSLPLAASLIWLVRRCQRPYCGLPDHPSWARACTMSLRVLMPAWRVTLICARAW
jgi:hypothetical protein